MALNNYRFWIATDSNRLLANQFAFIQATAPSFYQGNVAQLELHTVITNGVGSSPVEVPFPAGASITVAVGESNSYPTGGNWELSVGSTETQPIPYNATTTQLQEALNALAEVSAEGGVTVSKTGEGYTITWNTYGQKPTIGIGSDTLTPASYEAISLVQEGNAGQRQIVFVELRQNPIALGVDWTPLPNPTVSVTEVQGWNGINKIYRVGISPQPRAGTITISYGTKTATLGFNASASSIASALSPAQVFSTGQNQWDIVINEDAVLTAFGSLVGYNGYSGIINFATAECRQFLGGATGRTTTIEVSISVDGKRYTLLQTQCNILADVVSDGVLVPLPLGTAMSEQVANNRFVRRDVTQSPDAATQDIIWDNLGATTWNGAEIALAINNANNPSEGNPFATVADLSGSGIPDAPANGVTYGRKDNAWTGVLPLTGGTVTGSISAQTNEDYGFDINPSAAGNSQVVLYKNSDNAYTNIVPGAVQVSYAGYTTQINQNGVVFPDNTTQSTAASPFNGGTITNPIRLDNTVGQPNYIEIDPTPGGVGFATISLYSDAAMLVVDSTGITFSDGKQWGKGLVAQLNLSDLTNVAGARTNLGVFGKRDSYLLQNSNANAITLLGTMMSGTTSGSGAVSDNFNSITNTTNSFCRRVFAPNTAVGFGSAYIDMNVFCRDVNQFATNRAFDWNKKILLSFLISFNQAAAPTDENTIVCVKIGNDYPSDNFNGVKGVGFTRKGGNPVSIIRSVDGTTLTSPTTFNPLPGVAYNCTMYFDGYGLFQLYFNGVPYMSANIAPTGTSPALPGGQNSMLTLCAANQAVISTLRASAQISHMKVSVTDRDPTY